jgi:trigger factor
LQLTCTPSRRLFFRFDPNDNNHSLKPVNISVQDISDTRKELTVTVGAAEIAAEAAAVLKRVSQAAKIPGFRPGKAPEPVIRQKYKRELQEELQQAVGARVFREAIENNDQVKVVNIVSFPPLTDLTPHEDKTLVITVDALPAFEMPTYHGIPITVQKAEASDAEVDAVISNIRTQRGTFEAVERAALQGDFVKMSYAVTLDGVPAADALPELAGNTEAQALLGIEDGWEAAGDKTAYHAGVPAVIDALVGLAAGATVEVDQTYGDDHRVEALRGKTLHYAVTVHEVRERVPAAIDDTFLRSLRVASLEELKDRILDDLETRAREQQVQSKRDQASRHLLDGLTFEVPDSLLDGETQTIMGRIMVQNMQRGVPEEEFVKNKEAFHADCQEIARRELRLRFVLERIAQAENIEVTSEELSRAVYNLAMQQRTPVDDIVRDLRKNRERVRNLQRQVLLGKAIDLVVDKASITEVAADPAAAHGHDHSHDHGADHDHGHDHHEHGPGCGCGHDHDHDAKPASA